MTDRYEPPKRTWPHKFAVAGRSVVDGMRGQNSFYVHLTVAGLVVLLGLFLGLSRGEWSVITLSIFGVLTAEMLNRALEVMARAVTREEDPHIRRALDLASAAVLLAASGAIIVGLLILAPRLWRLLF